MDFWSRVMGRCAEDTQAEIENRIAKRGIHLLKKYSEYHKFLSERLFRLHPSTFSTADKCIFYIGKKIYSLSRVRQNVISAYYYA